ncbi:protein arginine N-methyltransferase 3 isoform X3 [Zootermopsis nevadensis]|uniref:type I protein arginine methyltransferase n=1 Tax=Zootermopsis nevadensis TaxID=136037 RepID=A0A067RDQ9_ZOONE|nr:protein arginine N-methyltransferase 3 isoform X3 [Zootermopsis nevadensis]KDR16996.1 Protein arginine N-methyltransferase 3 [Zootermopsis nevadensis]
MADGESVPVLCCESDSADSDDDSDWKEFDVEDYNTEHMSCLFCPQVYETISEVLSHCYVDHGFDLVKLKGRFGMDCYGYIKLVNYVRTHHPDASLVMSVTEPVWEKEEYMKPVKPDDPLLMYDFDDIELPSPITVPEIPSNSAFHVNAEDGLVTLTEQHFAELQRTIQSLASQVLEKDLEINTLMENIEKMRCVTQELVAGEESEENSSLPQCIKAIKLEGDEGYFNTYSHFSIHHEMLSDHVRTSSYRDAFMLNSTLWKDRTFLDLGCGTGILSMFAASAGARKVIAIDQSDIIYHAIDIVRENKLSDKIQLIKGRIEDTKLPQTHVDVIVSEWMGYFLLFEGMLDSLVYARDHHLAEGGLLLPNRCSISLVGLADTDRHAELVGFWTDVYGYRMTCLQHEVVQEATIEVVPPDKIITSPCLLTELDLNTCCTNSLHFSSELKLEAIADGSITAFVGYFDVFFDLAHPVSFSTGPHAKPTHWKQTVFLLEEPIIVKQGDVLTGRVICQRDRRDVRALSVTFLLLARKLKFILS